MALTQCPECAGQVSDQAISCPHCGYPLAKLIAKTATSTVQDKICPKCGEKNRHTRSFCFCGHVFFDSETEVKQIKNNAPSRMDTLTDKQIGTEQLPTYISVQDVKKSQKAPIQCPGCKMLNPSTAGVCDCGFDFQTGLPVYKQPYGPTNSILDFYFRPWKKILDFSGRASRKEYWLFFLFNIVIIFCLAFIDGILSATAENNKSELSGYYYLATILPTLAVGVRRMHDSDHRGWWLILPIANLLFLLIEGDTSSNKYGPAPK